MPGPSLLAPPALGRAQGFGFHLRGEEEQVGNRTGYGLGTQKLTNSSSREVTGLSCTPLPPFSPLACSRVRLVLGAAEARFKARGLLYAVFFPPRHFFGQNHALVLQSHGVRRQAGVTQGISQVGNRIHHRSTQQTLHSRGAAAVLGSSTQALSSPSDPLNSFNSSVHAGLHQCWVSRRGRAGEAQGQKTGQHTEISPMFNKGIQVFLPFP